MTKDQVLKLAMEAMEITGGFDVEINAIKEALAQPEQKPVMRIVIEDGCWIKTTSQQFYRLPDGENDLFAAPPRRKPLTDKRITKVISQMPNGINGWMSDWDLYEYTRAVEAAHEIKGDA